MSAHLLLYLELVLAADVGQLRHQVDQHSSNPINYRCQLSCFEYDVLLLVSFGEVKLVLPGALSLLLLI